MKLAFEDVLRANELEESEVKATVPCGAPSDWKEHGE